MPKYSTHKKYINDFKSYKSILHKRGLKEAEYLNTPIMIYPSEDEIMTLKIAYEVWASDSRMYKLSKKYYNDENFGWVILFFNKIGCEYNIKNGQILAIPTPIDSVLEMIGQ
jgi:hypothetical protein